MPEPLSTEERAERLLFIAEHLFQMVPREIWRDHGGDDQQGHYEGDYHAEQTRVELAEHRTALASVPEVER